jgi:hypothetical protein
LPPYSFADFDRRMPMLWLAVGFAVLLVASGRLHGLRALVGLVASLLIVVGFLIPAILHGHSALAVAVVGSFGGHRHQRTPAPARAPRGRGAPPVNGVWTRFRAKCA